MSLRSENYFNENSRLMCNKQPRHRKCFVRGFIIHQIFSIARDWSKRVTWANIPQLKLGNIRGYSPIFKTDFKDSSHIKINVRMAERFAFETEEEINLLVDKAVPENTKKSTS